MIPQLPSDFACGAGGFRWIFILAINTSMRTSLRYHTELVDSRLAQNLGRLELLKELVGLVASLVVYQSVFQLRAKAENDDQISEAISFSHHARSYFCAIFFIASLFSCKTFCTSGLSFILPIQALTPGNSRARSPTSSA